MLSGLRRAPRWRMEDTQHLSSEVGPPHQLSAQARLSGTPTPQLSSPAEHRRSSVCQTGCLRWLLPQPQGPGHHQRLETRGASAPRCERAVNRPLKEAASPKLRRKGSRIEGPARPSNLPRVFF